jgi:short subunit fatty acids transporter
MRRRSGTSNPRPRLEATARQLRKDPEDPRFNTLAISTPGTYPVLIAVYSTVLGSFVPSAGSKWLIETPYLLQAATQLHVNLGCVVQTYNTAEALPNLINPFWMLPLLAS